MYYPEELIEEVRQRNPIVDVIGSYVQLTKKGGNYFGLCPFHNEKSPSFSVSPTRQMYHCFGCGAGGNVLTFIMDYENYSFPEAMEMLADRAGITLPKQEYTPKMKAEQDARSILLQMHKDAAIFYVNVLRSEAGKLGMAYLEKRQIGEQMIRSFGLGYAPQSSNALYQYLRKKGYTDAEMKDSGLVTIQEKGARDKFWNRVMFPIMDTNNRVIGFGGRVMGDGEPKYLNSPETKIFDKSRNLYGLNAAKRSREKYLLVCEGYMDVISMHQSGFTNAVASLGTAFTSQHGMILKRYTEEVVLCYDSDGAGRKAALRAIPILKEAGLRIKVLNLEPYKDPDEFIKNLGKEEFQKRIDSAVNSFLFEISALRQDYDFTDPEEKSSFFNETAGKLAGFQDAIERDFYTEAVAKQYGVDYSLLKSKVNLLGNQVGIAKKSEETWQPKSGIQSKKKDRGMKEAEKLILTRLSDAPELFAGVRKVLSPADFSEALTRQVAEELFSQLEKGPSALNPAAILNHFIDGDQYREAAEIFSSGYEENLSEEERTLAFREAVLRVKEASYDEKIKNAADPAALMELLKGRQELKCLKLEF